MAISVDLEDGMTIHVPILAVDGRNWTKYCKNLLRVAEEENLVKQYDGTDTRPVDTTSDKYIAATFPDALFTHVMHLKTVRELFQYLANLFETKKSDATQREAMCNPRTPVSICQTHSEHARKAQDHEEAVKKAESTVVEEPRDTTCHKTKCDARSHGRVDRKGREGERAARRTSEQGATARGPGKEAMDQGASSIGQAVMPSSQGDDGRDTGVHCTPVVPQKSQVASGRAGKASADATNPCTMSTGPAEPAGGSPKPLVELHEIADSDNEAQGVDEGVERGREARQLDDDRPRSRRSAQPECNQVEGEQSPVVQIEQEDDGMPPVQQCCEDRQRKEHDPGGSLRRRSQSRRVEGEIGDRSDGVSSGRDGGANSDAGATSSTSRDSRRVETGLLAEGSTPEIKKRSIRQIWGTMEIAKGVACKTHRENNGRLLFDESRLIDDLKDLKKIGDL
ncbi:hypothetical protein BU15DRAFT_61614 [Melanogaster broomeanus]|nr:hypothetical protein BU15DRAFT_61614 [Melanogaster broomeanus]